MNEKNIYENHFLAASQIPHQVTNPSENSPLQNIPKNAKFYNDIQNRLKIKRNTNSRDPSRNTQLPIGSKSQNQHDNISQRTFNHINQNMTNYPSIIDRSGMKKSKKLRKNFDMMNRAVVKNSSAQRQGGGQKINLIQEASIGSVSITPQSQQNRRVQENPPQISVRKIIQFQPTLNEFRSKVKQNQPKYNSCYEIDSYNIEKKENSQGVHNQSLFSQISMRDTSSPDKMEEFKGKEVKRYQKLQYYGIQQTTQSQRAGSKNAHLKVSEKLMRQFFGMEPQTNNQNTSIQPSTQRENSQAILNISTAQDINIYNNSFILNPKSSTKKTAPSQIQNRSQSTKRPSIYPISSKQSKMRGSKLSQPIPYEQQMLPHQRNRSGSASRLSNNSSRNLNQVHSETNYQKLSQIAEAYSLSGKKNSIMQQIQGNLNKEQSQRQIKQQNSHSSFDSSRSQDSSVKKILSSYSSQQNVIPHTFSTSFRSGSQSVKRQRENPLQAQVNDYSPQPDNQRMIQQYQKSGQLFQSGMNMLQQKQYGEAIKAFEQALQHDSNNLDAKFYKSLCLLDQGEIDQSIKEFQQILKLSDCIKMNKNYSEAYLARGQAHLIKKQYERAQKDFQKYSELTPLVGIGFIGSGDCLKELNKESEAVPYYTKAIQVIEKNPQFNKDESHLIQAYLKRGQMYFILKDYLKAQLDFQFILLKDPKNVKAHFFLGKTFAREQNNSNNAILHFEQVVKFHTNEVYAGTALFEIAKIKIKEKDFYEAYFNIRRAIDINFTSKRMQIYRDFTEGVLYLIKRKIKKGIQILSDLLEVLVNNKEEKDKKMRDYLIHQVHIYRSYGYVAIEKYEMAIEDINKAKKLNKIDAASVYNKLLGKGILKMDNEEFIMATKFFEKAATKFPCNKDTYCLSIISIVNSYSYTVSGMKIDEQAKRDKVLETLDFMERSIKSCYKQKEPSLHFFRGLLHFQLHNFYKALQDFNIAIEAEEEPTAIYYLARGRCFACLSILSEAMKDISIALNLDETLQDGYIFRGKAAYLLGDNNLAFLDFQRLILSDPKNPLVHVYAGNLLMTTGAYLDAIKAYENADTVDITAVAAFQRARCYSALTELERATEELETTFKFQQDALLTIDYEIMTSLLKTEHCMIEQKTMKKTLKEILNNFNEIIVKLGEDYQERLKKKDCPLTIQIIPNVQRIKVEKLAVAKDIVNSQGGDQTKKLSLSLEFAQSMDVEQIKLLRPYSYYYENIFQEEDIIMYRGMINFYLGEFEQAIKDIQMSNQIKNENERKVKVNQQSDSVNVYSNQSTPMISMHTSKTDLSDIGLCSFNLHEHNYNVLLCYLFLKDKDNSLAKVNELLRLTPKKYNKEFYLIRGLLNYTFNNKEQAQKDFERYETQDALKYDQFIKDKQQISFEPFQTTNRLCSRFPELKLKISPSHPALLVRPSFSMPFIKPPNMIPNIDEIQVQSEFNLKQIDAPMPEAPWIKRCQHGIKFTDEMQEEDIDLTDEPNPITQIENTPVTPKQDQKDKEDLKINQKQMERKHLSEQVLNSKIVCLVENDDDDESQDNQQISLLDDSKFEDNTLEHRVHECDQESDLDEDDNSDGGQRQNVAESMVIMAEGTKNKIIISSYIGKSVDVYNNPMNIVSDDEQPEEQGEPEKVFSELKSCIGESQDRLERESLFRSRRSSLTQSKKLT